MRNLFLALVLANLAFAAWHAWLAAPTDPAVRASDEDVPGISLASERSSGTSGMPGPSGTPGPSGASPRATNEPAASADDAGPAAAPAADADSRPVCISVGPFMELTQAAAAAATLRGQGLEPTQRVAEGDVWVGYWVYIEGIGAQDEGNEILAELQEAGMEDPYLISETDGSHLISLGIYSEAARAGRRRDAVRALGHEVTIADRSRRGTVYWVDVTLGADRTLDLETLQPPGRIMRLEQRRCARGPFEPLPPGSDEEPGAEDER